MHFNGFIKEKNNNSKLYFRFPKTISKNAFTCKENQSCHRKKCFIDPRN